MLHIVLYEINSPKYRYIMRTCVGISAKLHLIEPLGFSLEDKYLKRSHLDYFDNLNFEVHKDFNESYLKIRDHFSFDKIW